jgi:hypothetical protein
MSVPAIRECGLELRAQAESINHMVRKLWLQYPGAIYRVMNRGDWREPIEIGGVFLRPLAKRH